MKVGDSFTMTWHCSDRNFVDPELEGREMVTTGPLTTKAWQRALRYMKEKAHGFEA